MGQGEVLTSRSTGRRRHAAPPPVNSNVMRLKVHMEIPESMKEELGAWNNGKGIDLYSWVVCSGNFSLGVGYLELFWPEFVEFEGYVLRKDFSIEHLRCFQSQDRATKESTEWVMNHIHLDGLQHGGCEDISKDKLVFIGRRLQEMYEAKLKLQFPERTFVVEFYVPEDEELLDEYQLSFYQSEVVANA